MAAGKWRAIDGDGHVVEVADQIADFLEPPYRGRRSAFPLFPTLDGRVRQRRGNPPTSPESWRAFLDYTDIAQAVVYPTLGLTLGLIQEGEWAAIVARAYNNWLA